jgi:hypothetical protein
MNVTSPLTSFPRISVERPFDLHELHAALDFSEIVGGFIQ